MRVRIAVDYGDCITTLRRLGQAGRDTTKAYFGVFTGRVVAKAKPLTPVEPEDGGQLRDSVRATKPTVTQAGLVSAGVVAGGAPLKASLSREHHNMNVYAVVQHEDAGLKHSVGGPKYIERPFLEEIERVPDELLEALDRVANA